jgi:glutathione synthase
MKFVFLMDPLESVVCEKDTTFAFMLGAHNRRHEVYYLPKDGITLQDGKLYFHVIKVKPQAILHQPFLEEHALRLSQDEIHAVFIRPDPPFDSQYLMNTWLLDHLPKRIAVVNSPSGVRTVNEKVWAAQFTEIIPPTIVSANKSDLINFVNEHKNVIAKPTDAFGGHSIFHIESTHTNTRVILETMTQRYNEPIILQKYIPEAKNGDKRILLLNGDPLGAVLRQNNGEDHRNNLFAGGTAVPATITARDLKIISVLKPHLQRLGLYFVGIDILGEYLIEVNVTSPTCLQEMARFSDLPLQEKVIEFVEGLIK